MKTPSIKTLVQKLHLDEARAKRVKDILTASRDELEELPTGAAMLANCYHPPYTRDLRLACLDVALETHGVEVFRTRTGDTVYYLNAGDTYAPTIIRLRDSYVVACWGDIVERHGSMND